ncbi:MAG: polysaccharide deacetylase family protein, partial [Chloroflexi bacterium]|nr:polysaccharide deacetylase family protein [Chloroflexota bacterium]
EIDKLSKSPIINTMIRKQPFFYIILLSLLAVTLGQSQANDQQDLPIMRGDGTLRRIRVPILMYHYVSELPPNADELRVGLTVSPQAFREQIQYLQANGYSTTSLYEIYLALNHGIPLPQHPVVLTFDDGYIDHYATVFPILQAHNFTGTFFISTEFADTNRPGHMSWEQITQMANAGMSMESHTKTHADLRERNPDFLVYEIAGSIESLWSHIGREPRMFAYPYGHYDDNSLRLLETTRVLQAVTTQPGIYHTTDNNLLMQRMRVTNETGISSLRYLLNYGG